SRASTGQPGSRLRRRRPRGYLWTAFSKRNASSPGRLPSARCGETNATRHRQSVLPQDRTRDGKARTQACEPLCPSFGRSFGVEKHQFVIYLIAITPCCPRAPRMSSGQAGGGLGAGERGGGGVRGPTTTCYSSSEKCQIRRCRRANPRRAWLQNRRKSHLAARNTLWCRCHSSNAVQWNSIE